MCPASRNLLCTVAKDSLDGCLCILGTSKIQQHVQITGLMEGLAECGDGAQAVYIPSMPWWEPTNADALDGAAACDSCRLRASLSQESLVHKQAEVPAGSIMISTTAEQAIDTAEQVCHTAAQVCFRLSSICHSLCLKGRTNLCTQCREMCDCRICAPVWGIGADMYCC